jgi:pimeloyl-ACP methyl ester carboxylesterase
MSEEQLTAESAKEEGWKGLGSERTGGLLSAICYSPGSFAAGLLALLFAGALFWATGRNPFQRFWFKANVSGKGKAECIAVLPENSLESKVQSLKSGKGRWPVVVYLHGSGGSLLGDGNELRQMAEMGVAAVGIEYCQTNEAVFEAQFSVLLRYLGRQSWADTNRIAWVGSSLGAQRSLAFALRHPETRPRFLVHLAGGWLPELESKVQSLKSKVHGAESKVEAPPSEPSTLNSQLSTSVLLLHGEQDEVFPLSEAQRVAACLETNSVPVELKVLPGESHGPLPLN